MVESRTLHRAVQRGRGVCLLLAGVFCLNLSTARAEEPEKPTLNMTLEWSFQGPQAVFTAAAERDFFKKEGLNVTVDRGSGSTDAVVKVASGAYDFGWSEM